MKKKIFAAAVAFVATMSLATSAFAATESGSTSDTAVEPGKTNGEAQVEVTVKDGEKTEFKTDVALEVEAPAGAFEKDAKVTMEADVAPAADAAATVTAAEKAVAVLAPDAKDDAAKVSINTKLDITFKVDNKAVQPKEAVTVTVAHDGKSNVVVYVDGDKVQFIKLTVTGGMCSFKASHFSDYYLAEVDASVLAKVEDKDANIGENNPGTGIALAVAPAALAVAFVGVTAAISKKKRG